MNLPTREQCFEFYKEFDTPKNIIEHVVVVNKLAISLAKKLSDKGIKLNMDLVDRASLLHDLDKWITLQDKTLKHGYETERILKEKGFPEVGHCAKQHVLERVSDDCTWEEKIIIYADKRVLFDKIVSLNKRFDYINKKYPTKDLKKRQEFIDMTYELEKEICSIIKITPEDIADVSD